MTSRPPLTILFAQTFIHDKFDYHDDYVKLFGDKSIDMSIIEPNTDWDCNVHTSRTDDGENWWDDGAPKDLSIDLLSCINNITGIEFEYSNSPVYSPWFNIYKKGWNQERHNHVGDKNILSGVWFVKNASTIRFFNQIIPNMVKSNILYRNGDDPLNKIFPNNGREWQEIYPEDGDLILFPSEQDHSVPIYNGDSPRITVSFNLKIKE